MVSVFLLLGILRPVDLSQKLLTAGEFLRSAFRSSRGQILLGPSRGRIIGGRGVTAGHMMMGVGGGLALPLGGSPSYGVALPMGCPLAIGVALPRR